MLEWIARKYPTSEYTGVDISERLAREAEERFTSHGPHNITIIVGDAADMPSDLTAKFDLVFMREVFHDLPYPSKAAKEFYRILKPGGILAIIDPSGYENPHDNIGNQQLSMFYPCSLYNCLSTAMNHPGCEGLGVCPGREKVIRIIHAAGFKVTHVKDIS